MSLIRNLLGKFPQGIVPKSLSARIIAIAVPIVIILIILAFVLDFLTVGPRLSGGDQVAPATDETAIEGAPPTARFTPRSSIDLRASEQLEKEALEAERIELDQRLAQYQEQQELLKKQKDTLAEREKTVDSKVSNLDLRRKDLGERKEKLDAREQQIETRERRQEEEKLAPQPQEETEEQRLAKEREQKKLAKGFSTMRPKEVANILLEMLKEGDEGQENVLRPSQPWCVKTQHESRRSGRS